MIKKSEENTKRMKLDKNDLKLELEQLTFSNAIIQTEVNNARSNNFESSKTTLSEIIQVKKKTRRKKEVLDG